MKTFREGKVHFIHPNFLKVGEYYILKVHSRRYKIRHDLPTKQEVYIARCTKVETMADAYQREYSSWVDEDRPAVIEPNPKATFCIKARGLGKKLDSYISVSDYQLWRKQVTIEADPELSNFKKELDL